MSRYLFSELGVAKLEQLNRKPFLLAFDFDGTLAPFVDDPAKARVPHGWRGWLDTLALHRPIAVISGRCVYQLQGCLQMPQCLMVGNHGAQPHAISDGYNNSEDALVFRWIDALDPCREQIALQRGKFQQAGVVVEDKGFSIALHYRMAADKPAAQDLLEKAVKQWLRTHGKHRRQLLRVWRGHDVINLISADAPDKGDALIKLQKYLGMEHALFVGDDSNDEPAFEKASPGSVTVKIGCAATPTSAQFFLPLQSNVGQLLRFLTGQLSGLQLSR